MLKLRKLRKVIVLVLVLLLAFPGLAAATETESSSFELQLVSDQGKVDKSGKIGFHILYHNVDNRKLSKAWVKVKVSDDLEVDDAAGAEWEADTRTLKWKLKELDNNGADIIHFQLKLKANAKAASFELICTGGIDDHTTVHTPNVTIHVGPRVDQPVFNGYPDGKFRPHSNLTRAETAAIISRLSNLPASKKSYTYKDVSNSSWAYSYIQKVTEAGYMSGYNGQFRPNEPITTGELVVLMLRVRGIKPYPMYEFSDSKGKWSAEAAGTAKALRYFDGYGNNEAKLDNPIEREAAAKLICLMYQRGQLTSGETEVIQHWPDVPKQRWSFGWVEELSLVAHESSSMGPFEEKLIQYLPGQTEPF